MSITHQQDQTVLSWLDETTWPAAHAVTGTAPSGAAACLDADPELFFSESPAELERAKLVCVACPLQQECLAGALARKEPHGVWGGEIFDDGVVIPRKRPRGRPRKHPLAAELPGHSAAA